LKDTDFTEGHKEAEAIADPEILRGAKGFAKQLEKITIFIEDDQFIVGNLASKPMGLELSGSCFREELDGFANIPLIVVLTTDLALC
jgi:hypothetical protein